MTWYLKALKNYATFDGRARRIEYWMFTIVNFVVMFGLVGLSTPFRGEGIEAALEVVFGLFFFAMLVPGITVTVRRLHDVGRSGGWWFIRFIPLLGEIILFVFLVMPGTRGRNRYGLDPKAMDDMAPAVV